MYNYLFYICMNQRAKLRPSTLAYNLVVFTNPQGYLKMAICAFYHASLLGSLSSSCIGSFFLFLRVYSMFELTFCGGLLLHQCISCSKPNFVVVLKCLSHCIIAGRGQISWKGTLWFYLLWKDLNWCYVHVSYSVALFSASRHNINLSVVYPMCFEKISQE